VFQSKLLSSSINARKKLALYLLGKNEDPDYDAFTNAEYLEAKKSTADRIQHACQVQQEEDEEEQQNSGKTGDETDRCFSEKALGNIMLVSKWNDRYLYCHFCKQLNDLMNRDPLMLAQLTRDAQAGNKEAERALEAMNKESKAKKKENSEWETALSLTPEVYQILYAMHYLMESAIKDPFNQGAIAKLKRTEYAPFLHPDHETGSERGLLNEDIVRRVPWFEDRVDRLPLAGSIPGNNFARVMNKNYANVCAFLALAIFDSKTHLRAGLFLDQDNHGDYDIQIFEEADLKNQLSNSCNEVTYPVTSTEQDFLLYCVEPLNKLSRYLNAICGVIQKTECAKRVNSASLRTLAADMVQIYVQNGRSAPCDKHIEERHPHLQKLVQKHGKSHKFVPLVFEFILQLILDGKIEVTRSHYMDTLTAVQAALINERNAADDVASDQDKLWFANNWLSEEFGHKLTLSGKEDSQMKNQVFLSESAEKCYRQQPSFSPKYGPPVLCFSPPNIGDIS